MFVFTVNINISDKSGSHVFIHLTLSNILLTEIVITNVVL